MNNNVIECNNLCHAYGKRIIYENLNFCVPQGRIMGLLGKNGTGKTTTINILNGYLQPLGGSCTIFGENCNNLTAKTKGRIGLLIEGHVQYNFMNTKQLEKFYKPFYPKWNAEIYYTLISKLKISPQQNIGSMSNGQRSQVALAILLAQEPDLLILDDFSLGLDPGYRRLFTDILRQYTVATNKTIFLTSHIIQDMERLIDDCIIMGYGGIITQQGVHQLLNHCKRFTFNWPKEELPKHPDIFNPERQLDNSVEAYTLQPLPEVQSILESQLKDNTTINLREECNLTLEDIFIGLTGKY